MAKLDNLAGVDLSEVSTKYPVIQVGVYAWRITESKVIPVKSDPTRSQWELKLELESSGAIDNKDQPIQKGYVLTHRVGLSPTDKRTNEMIVRDVCTVIDACWGEDFRKSLGSLDEFDTDTVQGQVAMAKTSIDPEDAQYPEKARIARFIAKDQSATIPNDPAQEQSYGQPESEFAQQQQQMAIEVEDLGAPDDTDPDDDDGAEGDGSEGLPEPGQPAPEVTDARPAKPADASSDTTAKQSSHGHPEGQHPPESSDAVQMHAGLEKAP